MAPPVLFCSSGIWSDHSEAIQAAAPGVEAVIFRTGQRVPDDDVARITIAFASDDLYPAGLPGFFRVCLDSRALDWVQVFNAGIDHPVFRMLMDKGARLTTGSGTSAIPIAHHVVMCLLALIRDLPASIARQHRHEWQPRMIPDVEGRTLGVLGMGPIGSEVARLGSHFGMNVIALRRNVTGFEMCETWTMDRLDELLGVVDDLVLALPLTPDTRHLIGERELLLMRPGSRLVNVGRGELVDEQAMIDALQTGQLGGAALDVFAVEPLPDDSPLWDMPNVIITPHNSGDSAMATRRVNELFVTNLGLWQRGEPLQNEVTTDVGGGGTPG
ncbi:MAG: D-2-hydroxyacid dehydrogenase [Ilumatobacteraceae bacterium]